MSDPLDYARLPVRSPRPIGRTFLITCSVLSAIASLLLAAVLTQLLLLNASNPRDEATFFVIPVLVSATLLALPINPLLALATLFFIRPPTHPPMCRTLCLILVSSSEAITLAVIIAALLLITSP